MMRHLPNTEHFEVGQSVVPLENLTRSLQQTSVCRFFERLDKRYRDAHLKDATVQARRPGRWIKVRDRWVVNFGSDSFLGLDEDARLHQAITDGLLEWGTHNGTSRMFSSVAANVAAERRLARWIGTETTLIYPSVTLANHSAIPALLTRQDVAVVDRRAHHSVHEGFEIAASRNIRTESFPHNDLASLEKTLQSLRPYRNALIAVDGVYSMSGALAPLRELNAIALRNSAVLYVDDAHGTGVIGDHGRGTVPTLLGDFSNVLAVGSLSKALSCFGGYIACSSAMQRLLKMRSSAFIFGGPVPPPYLNAICAAVDIVESAEYADLRARLEANVHQLLAGAKEIGLNVLGGETPIVSILIGDEDTTIRTGQFLFEAGFYVQSVTLPAVPANGGVLRIQVNSNHTAGQIDSLLSALARLPSEFALPCVRVEGDGSETVK